MKSFSHVLLLATPWTAAHQAPPSVGFSRQEHWSGVPCIIKLNVYILMVSNDILIYSYYIDVNMVAFVIYLKEEFPSHKAKVMVFETNGGKNL